jgi:hypothetical protein
MSRSLLKTPLVEERHYTPAELGAMWGFSAGTIRRMIQDEQGVLRLQGMGATTGKRPYSTYPRLSRDAGVRAPAPQAPQAGVAAPESKDCSTSP